MDSNDNYDHFMEDRLVFRRRKHGVKKMVSQRKRLPNNTSTFDREVQKAYLGSTALAVRFIMGVKRWSIGESFAYVKKLRGSRHQYHGQWTKNGCFLNLR